MRISDWSSDVCSSDLILALCILVVAIGGDRGQRRAGEIPAELARHAPILGVRPIVDAGGGRLAADETGARRRDLVFGAEELAQRQQRVRRRNRKGAGTAGQAWPGRSEERR